MKLCITFLPPRAARKIKGCRVGMIYCVPLPHFSKRHFMLEQLKREKSKTHNLMTQLKSPDVNNARLSRSAVCGLREEMFSFQRKGVEWRVQEILLMSREPGTTRDREYAGTERLGALVRDPPIKRPPLVFLYDTLWECCERFIIWGLLNHCNPMSYTGSTLFPIKSSCFLPKLPLKILWEC